MLVADLHFKDFKSRCMSLIVKLLEQNFKLHKLKSAYHKLKFCLRHKTLLVKYGNKPYNWIPGVPCFVYTPRAIKE